MLKNIFQVVNRDISVYVLNFLLNIIIARNLGVSEFGIWAVFIMILQYLDTFFRPKSDLAMAYFVGKKNMPLNNAIIWAIFLFLLFAIVILPIIWLTPDFILTTFQLTNSTYYRNILRLVAVYYLFHGIYLCIVYSFTAICEYKIYNKLILIYASVNILIMSWLFLLFDPNILLIILSMYVSMFISITYGILKIWPFIEFRFPKSLGDLKPFFKYSSSFYLSSILLFINENTTKHIALFFLSPKQFAYLWQGYGLALILNRLSASIVLVLYPEYSRKSEKESINGHVIYFRRVFLLLCPIALIIFFNANFIVITAYGVEFFKSGNVLMVCVWGSVAIASASVLQNYFFTVGRPWVVLKIIWFPIFTQILLSYFLISKFLFEGAIYSLLISNLIFSLTIIILFKLKTKTEINEILPKYRDAKLIILKIFNQINKIRRV